MIIQSSNKEKNLFFAFFLLAKKVLFKAGILPYLFCHLILKLKWYRRQHGHRCTQRGVRWGGGGG
jgi:hypothetical protein